MPCSVCKRDRDMRHYSRMYALRKSKFLRDYWAGLIYNDYGVEINSNVCGVCLRGMHRRMQRFRGLNEDDILLAYWTGKVTEVIKRHGSICRPPKRKCIRCDEIVCSPKRVCTACLIAKNRSKKREWLERDNENRRRRYKENVKYRLDVLKTHKMWASGLGKEKIRAYVRENAEGINAKRRARYANSEEVRAKKAKVYREWRQKVKADPVRREKLKAEKSRWSAANRAVNGEKLRSKARAKYRLSKESNHADQP